MRTRTVTAAHVRAYVGKAEEYLAAAMSELKDGRCDKERRALCFSLARTLQRWASAEPTASRVLRQARDRIIATIPS